MWWFLLAKKQVKYKNINSQPKVFKTTNLFRDTAVTYNIRTVLTWDRKSWWVRRLDYMQARGEACIASQHRDECSSHSITAVSSPAVRAMFRKAGLNVSGAWSVRSKFRKSIKVLVPFAFPSSSGFFWSLFSLSKASTDLFDLRPSLLGGLSPFHWVSRFHSSFHSFHWLL